MLNDRLSPAGPTASPLSRRASRPSRSRLAVAAGLVSASLLATGSALAACSGASPTWTSTIDYASVNSCVTQAKAGDRINVGAGTATWSSTLTINKALTLAGAGDTSSIINGGSAVVIVVNLPSAAAVRITGFGFTGTGGSTQLESTLINLRGTLENVRLDHLRFTNIQNHAVYVGLWDAIPKSPKILFDNITYTSSLTSGFQRFVKIMGNNSTWTQDDNYGTDNFVFIEDSTFTWTGAASTNSGVTDTEHGARLVVRYNTINGGGVQVHDTGSTPAAKGQRATEVYNNTFSCAITGCSNIPAIGIRGGGWLIWGNTFKAGFWTPGFPQIYRATMGPGYLGQSCNGTPMPACNTPTYYHCSGGDRRACSYSGDSVCSGIGSCVIAATDASSCPAAYPFIPNLDRVNGGSGASGYPCRHQSGWGKESADGKTQQPSPVYWWNNKNASAQAVNLSYDVSPWFLVNRDYCNRDPSSTCGARTAWTYTPYTYPHPLQSGAAAAAPPPPANPRFPTS